MLNKLTQEEIDAILTALPTLPRAEQEQILRDLEELERKQQVESAKSDFLAFCHYVYPGFKEGPHHRHMRPLLHGLNEGNQPRLTVSMPPRFGKALALDTEIPTPDRGFVRMGDLRVGDLVFAVDGTPTLVTGVSPIWRNRPVYQVKTNDSYSVIADEAHEWTVSTDQKRQRWRTVDTKWVAKKAKPIDIPLQDAAKYPEKTLPIDPYVLGTWLSGARKGSESIHASLRELGVLESPHIPDSYLQASTLQRLALLHGLREGGATRALATQTKELEQSLGIAEDTQWRRRITATPAGTADTVCIEVAHPSHLFLCTRGYIATHNSESVAYLFVSWYLGHHPDHHIMMVTHTADLSADFGRKVRNMLDSDIYHEVFPDTVVSRDKSAASNWSTTKGGKYLAIGIGANVAGHGAHCLHPNTKIAGAGSLGHLSIGDTVLTKYGRQRVTKKLLTAHDAHFTLNGGLVASGNHPIHTTKGWTRVDALKVGDRIETLTIWRRLWLFFTS